MTDSMSQHCPNCEAQAAEIERHREQAAAEDRAKIVAWLYDEQREYPRTEYSGFAAMIAEMIEAKEHLK
jgi:hypothetical protein